VAGADIFCEHGFQLLNLGAHDKTAVFQDPIDAIADGGLEFFKLGFEVDEIHVALREIPSEPMIPVCSMNRTFFFCIVPGLVLAALAAAANASPKLECREPVYDFGTVDGSTPVSHTFKIRNAGESDLVIKKIHAPCGCTAFRLANKILPPGESLGIPVTVSLQGRKGLQEKGVYLETNDPEFRSLKLLLRGTVGSGIEIQPPMMTLRKNPKSPEVFGEVTVRDLAKKPLRCLEAKALEGKVEVVATPLAGGEGFVLRATPAANLAPGQHKDKIRLLLEGASSQTMDIDVLILLPADLIVAPSVLRLDSTSAAPLSRTIIIRSPGGIDFTIDSVEVPVDSMTTRIERMNATSSRVVVGNIHPARDLDGKKLILRIGGDKSRTLEIPVAVPR
jgi:hypothetical protein